MPGRLLILTLKRTSSDHAVMSLLSDFGLSDPFVAEMKAVVLGICPEVKIIDITHQVRRFDVRMGSFLLAGAVPYFPAGTVHCAVVDPGVGSGRRAIVVESQRSVFVGPDNSLLISAARREGIVHVYELTNRSLMREEVSATFHGRDVFAPAAAHLACGTAPKDCGPEITDYVQPSYAEPKIDRKSVSCEIFHIDIFGNIVTNISNSILPNLSLRFGKNVPIMVGRRRLSARYVRTYSDLEGKEFGVLVGSHGFLEIACREVSAADRLRARIGAAVRVFGV